MYFHLICGFHDSKSVEARRHNYGSLFRSYDHSLFLIQGQESSLIHKIFAAGHNSVLQKLKHPPVRLLKSSEFHW